MLECVDLFCGAGGLSWGLQKAGLKIVLAIDSNPHVAKTYVSNFPDVEFLTTRIQDITVNEIRKRVKNTKSLVLAGGPPCQLFSRLNKQNAPLTDEIIAYAKLITDLKPLFVLLENVPQIQQREEAWNLLISTLNRLKYTVQFAVLNSFDFGVPQSRERLFIVAGPCSVNLVSPVNVTKKSVRDAIGHLPSDSNDIPNHVGMSLSPTNLTRIRRIGPGENSRDRKSAFQDRYARMSWDRPSPTITTKCISFSNGRYGHPVYDRAITVREAAILQGFPDTFMFTGSLWECARQVGNAVPPPIAEEIGKRILGAFKSESVSGMRNNKIR